MDLGSVIELDFDTGMAAKPKSGRLSAARRQELSAARRQEIVQTGRRFQPRVEASVVSRSITSGLAFTASPTMRTDRRRRSRYSSAHLSLA